MKTIIIALGLIFLTGCVTLEMTFDGDGFHFGLGGSFPDIPIIDYEKVLE